MQVTITPFDLAADDVDKAARLFYITDPVMGVFFGGEKQTLPALRRLIRMDHNHFSHKYILCAKHNGEVVGLLAGFDAAQDRLIERECGRDYLQALSLFQALRAGLVAAFMHHVFVKSVGEREFYINNLCVAPGHRSLGIGAALLGEVCGKYAKVTLGVSIDNHRGLKFYERNGFKIESTRKMRLFGQTFGAHNMAWRQS